MRRDAPALVLLAAGWAAVGPPGCGNAPTAGPPEILFGQDVCDVCGMIISDERFAAGLSVEADGRFETRAFDDLGCLLAYEDAHPGGPVAGRYVADYHTGAWRDADAAVYLHSHHLHTPMAFGLAAVATAAEAQALRETYPGDVIDFAEVRARFEGDRLATVPGPPPEGS